MRDIYVAAVLLVVAQIFGIYALVTRKADLVFAVFMVVVLVVAGFLGFHGVRSQI